jgi:hypothetical protein
MPQRFFHSIDTGQRARMPGETAKSCGFSSRVFDDNSGHGFLNRLAQAKKNHQVGRDIFLVITPKYRLCFARYSERLPD